MKFLTSNIDNCSGYKSISILQLKNGRSLFGLHYGYISIFYRIFYTNFQLVDIGILQNAVDTCNLNELTLKKLDAFLEEPLSLGEKIKYFWILNTKSWVHSKERAEYIKTPESLKEYLDKVYRDGKEGK